MKRAVTLLAAASLLGVATSALAQEPAAATGERLSQDEVIYFVLPDRFANGDAGVFNGVMIVDVKVAPLRTPPFAQGWFDVVVIPELIGAMRPHERVGTLQSARQVLRGGGRCFVIETAPRGGLGALFSARSVDPHYRAQGGAEAALRAEGFEPVRTLAERDGLLFTEGTKPDPA